MRLTVTPIEVPDDDPFRNDLLGRKKAAEALTELVRSSADPLTLCLDAPWGQGKTTFLKMWRGLLEKSGIPTVVFSAWEHDFAEDPLIVLIGELEAQVKTVRTADGHDRAVRLQDAKRLGLKLAKAALPTAVKIATAGVLNLNDFTEEALAEWGEKAVERTLAKYEEQRQSVARFHAALTEFASELGKRENGAAVPLVVLIDELDRCRPTYAIQLLERLKHLFAVPGIVYVLALDREQLGHSVRSQYGAGVDADGYLRRFFDLELVLTRPPPAAFCKAQFQRFGLETFFAKRVGEGTRYDRPQTEEGLSALFESFDCTLRDQERAFSLLSLVARTTPPNFFLYPLLLSALIVLKLKATTLYREFVAGSRQPMEVIARIGQSASGRELLNSNYGAALEAHLVACPIEKNRTGDLVATYGNMVSDPSLPDNAKNRARQIAQILGSHTFQTHAFGTLPYLVAKIELVSEMQR